MLDVFKDCIAEATPDGVGRRCASGRRVCRPKESALLIADVKGISGGVRDRIVVLRR
jgi:hypothetical protein